jgi:hypothetical protein
VVIRIEFELFRFFCPDACDVFVGRQAAQGLEPAAMILGVNEELEVLPYLVVAIVVVALDGRFLDGAVHPFDLAVIRHEGVGASRLG